MTAATPDEGDVQRVAEALHDEHCQEFRWTHTPLQECTMCQRWARYAVAILPARDARVATEARAAALREAAEAWRSDGRDVMFNRGGSDLRPEQRVGKWMLDRADAAERGAL